MRLQLFFACAKLVNDGKVLAINYLVARENRSLHAARLFQWSLHPSRGPGTGKKIYFIKYHIRAMVCTQP